MIAGVVILHIWALHVPGSNNPVGVEKQTAKDTLPFHPYFTVKDAFALVCFIIMFSWFVFYTPNYLGHADNYIPANPAVTPAHIVPEWYFLPFYAILRAVPDKLGGVLLMFGAIAVLVFLPWLDTSKVKSANYRPLFRQFFWVFAIVCVLLGWVGAKPAEGGYILLARVLTAYYFAHFLIILPLLGLFETPRKVPASIAEAVLGKGGSANAMAAGAHAEPNTKG
jgi:quinol-cytochrome oxidoreductase complex cytochrome b subunit